MSAVSELDSAPKVQSHGHSFIRKTFHRPSYCHQCTDLLWGIIQQGSVCEVCNFVVHDRCIRTVAYPCISVAITHIQNPVPHCWSEQGHYKRKFCNVCRKRLDESLSMRCEICEYYIHVDCQDFAIPNCMECATFIPERILEHSTHHHHWREGNLPTNSKCSVCKKSCWSAECLAGLRCEWCGMTVHGGCLKSVPVECIFGVLEPIVLPPSAVSIPRTEVPMEAVLGVTNRRKEAISRACSRAICEDLSSCDLKGKDDDSSSGGIPASKESKSGKKSDEKEREEREEEIIKVFDGNWSLRRRTFRLITVSKTATLDCILAAALKAFHIRRDPSHFYLTDAYAAEEKELADPALPLPTSLLRREGKRPALFLRLRDEEEGELEIFPSHLHGVVSPRIVKVNNETTVEKIIKTALPLFGIPNESHDKFQLTEMTLDKGVLERVMTLDEQPWELLKSTSRDSLRQMELTRFYLQRKEDPHGPTIALYVGNLPLNLSQRQYEQILIDILGIDNKYSSIGPIYYEYGALVITYTNCEEAVRAFYTCRDAFVEEKNLIVLLLPNVTPEMVPKKDRPLLVFVNVKSGGCQGLDLISSFRKLLNPYQVYDLTNGGPLPGLYVFRKIPNYRILCCGGDGTIGWVLQCLDNVGQDSVCSRPPCAIVPLGTGNDLARVLHWGAGYTGAEDPMSLLRDVIDAEEIRLDRWTVVVHCDETADPRPITQLPACAQVGTQQQDNTQIYVMNNYCGIGIDADLCLGFHNAREENPNKFNSRWTNKGVYVKLGMQKLVSRKMCKLCKDLQKHIVLEVDGKRVELPPIEGIIILNILSWGSGANPWGPEKDDNFTKPNHWDGILEIVGVTGPFHLGQIQSGLRSAIRIAQGGHIRIRVNSDVPVHVDGEPWIQGPCEITILRSALKATMLKKRKRLKRRNTESLVVPGGSLKPVAAAASGKLDSPGSSSEESGTQQ